MVHSQILLFGIMKVSFKRVILLRSEYGEVYVD